MAKGKRTLSQVVPVLVAALVCDVAIEDPSTGKKNLIGIFNRIHVTNFPTAREVFVYLKVTDAQGDYDTEVRYVQVNSGKLLAGANGELHATDRLASIDTAVRFPPLPIPVR